MDPVTLREHLLAMCGNNFKRTVYVIDASGVLAIALN